jgi:hypothetical protein
MIKKIGLPRLADLEDGFDAALDRVARKQSGHGPGHPAYEAIVNPPRRGRPRASEKRESVQKAIRLPKPLLKILEVKARKRRLSFNAAVREAIAEWAGHS